jgi:hypothetical protein
MSHEPLSGYRSKPFWIRLFALALILAPFGNLAFTFLALDLPLGNLRSWNHWLQYIRPHVWALNTLLFVAGISLLKVRTWTHLLASFALGAVMVYNIAFWQGLLMLGPLVFAAMAVATLVTAAFLYSREFRKPYFNPRLRWWETEPRYQARLPVTLESRDGRTHSGEILDVSRSGLFLALDGSPELQVGEEHHVRLPSGIEVRGQIVRRAPNGFGVSFVRLSWEQRARVKDFVRHLASDPRALLR